MTDEKSQSPGRRSISSQISAMGTKLGRALSREGGRQDFDRRSTTETVVNSEDKQGQDRSVSRGREKTTPSFGYARRTSTSRGSDGTESIEVIRGRDARIGQTISTGRGGAGNFMRSSSRDVEPESKGHVPSDKVAARALSTGRGGAGNIRSVSREGGILRINSHTGTVTSEAVRDEDAYEREVLARAAAAREQVHSTGRGGLGNISKSRSRSRSKGPGPSLHSTGRGGAGNLAFGDSELADIADEQERLDYARVEGIHSTGRGGVANVTYAPSPGIEILPHHEGAAFHSSGRGGAGNIRAR